MDIDPSILDKVGVVGICVFGVISLVRGWVIPGSWVTSRLAEKDEIILRQREALDVKDEQIEGLMEGGRTTQAVLRAVEALAARDKDGP